MDPLEVLLSSSGSRAAALDEKLMYYKELFQLLPKAFYKPIKTHILNTCHRNELIVRKMEGIHPLTRDGFLPKCLIVKMKLTCTEKMKNTPETCQHQKAWKETKKKFQEDMKKILAEQVRKDKKHWATDSSTRRIRPRCLHFGRYSKVVRYYVYPYP